MLYPKKGSNIRVFFSDYGLRRQRIHEDVILMSMACLHSRCLSLKITHITIVVTFLPLRHGYPWYFPLAPYQRMFMIVEVDYFAKCAKEKVLTKITAANILKFLKRYILAIYVVPSIVINNRT